MMDLSYICVPNSDGALIRINREPCYDKHLETFEEGIKNTYVDELLKMLKLIWWKMKMKFGNMSNLKTCSW